jgi:hypothetical protein
MIMGRWVCAVLLAFALVAGAGLWLQRETTAALESEIALLRDEQRALARLRAAHEKLIAEQVPEAEVARLRNDRAALMRLRSEIEQMQARADRMASAGQPAQKSAKAETVSAPALTLNLAIQPDGNLTLDGMPVDLDFEIKQRLAGLARGEFVKFRLNVPHAPQPGIMKQRVDRLMAMTKEFELRAEIFFDTAGK